MLRRWCSTIKPRVFIVNYQPTCILLLQVWRPGDEYENTEMHTLGQAPVSPPLHFSTLSTGVGGEGAGANETWRIDSWPDVRVPPIMAVGPLTARAIWAAEKRRQAHPFLCPALRACSQWDRLGELAGVSAPRSLTKPRRVLIILQITGVKNEHDSLYLMRLFGFTHSVWPVTDVSQLLH